MTSAFRKVCLRLAIGKDYFSPWKIFCLAYNLCQEEKYYCPLVVAAHSNAEIKQFLDEDLIFLCGNNMQKNNVFWQNGLTDSLLTLVKLNIWFPQLIITMTAIWFTVIYWASKVLAFTVQWRPSWNHSIPFRYVILLKHWMIQRSNVCLFLRIL